MIRKERGPRKYTKWCFPKRWAEYPRLFTVNVSANVAYKCVQYSTRAHNVGIIRLALVFVAR